MGNYIELYPTNWLYNAGVIGFLTTLDSIEVIGNNVREKYRFEDNYVKLNMDVFKYISHELYYNKETGKGKGRGKRKNVQNDEGNKVIVNLVGNNPYYTNFFDTQKKQIEVFADLLRAFSDSNMRISGGECGLCANPIHIRLDIKDGRYQNLDRGKKETKLFFNKIEEFNITHNKYLGASYNEFPNLYRSSQESLKICHLCSFIIIHHHLAFTDLSSDVAIFVNAPSIEVMYILNKLVKELSSYSSGKDVLEILGMSLIELSARIQTTINRWTRMNIEVVTRKVDKNSKKKAERAFIFYSYSLPQHTVDLLVNPDIASLVSRIGEFSVLECILEGKYEELLKMAHYALSSHMRGGYMSRQLKDYFSKERNQNNPLKVSRLVLELYGRIVDRRVKYERQ